MPGSAATACTRSRSPGRPSTRASALAVAAALVLTVAAAPGCASDAPTRPEAPEAVRPEGLTETRDAIAERRASVRDLMDQNLARPAAPAPQQGVVSSVFDFVGKAGKSVFDVLSLRAFGVW